MAAELFLKSYATVVTIPSRVASGLYRLKLSWTNAERHLTLLAAAMGM